MDLIPTAASVLKNQPVQFTSLDFPASAIRWISSFVSRLSSVNPRPRTSAVSDTIINAAGSMTSTISLILLTWVKLTTTNRMSFSCCVKAPLPRSIVTPRLTSCMIAEAMCSACGEMIITDFLRLKPATTWFVNSPVI